MNIAQPKFGMKFGVGTSAKRLEDDRFLRGHGRYTDDIKVEGVLHGFVLRSPVAKGSFTINDIATVQEADGVHLVLTGADLTHLGPVPCDGSKTQADGTEIVRKHTPVLCEHEVRFVGDAVAFIVADTLAQAKDAAELLDIDYDMGSPIVGVENAVKDDAPLVWPDHPNNKSLTYHLGDKAATDAAFTTADHITKIKFVNNRLVCNYMEPRAAIGEIDGETGQLILTVGSQGVHGQQSIVAEDIMKMPLDDLRVITPDVGGGFGPKGFTYREYPLVLEAAKRLGKPVKWTGDRTEHFLTDAQGRDNVVTAEMALNKEGRFLGMRVHLLADMGAYNSQYGPVIPWFGLTMATGVYDLQTIDMTIDGIFTNTCPVDAYRGAGRPEAAFLIERLADACAREMKIDPAELRRRNFIKPEQFPYVTVAGRSYDVGEFQGHLDLALERAEADTFDARLETSKTNGKIRGLGIATYIEACAFAGAEPAHVQLNDDGTVTCFIGTQSNGQGHETAYAQFVSEKLDLPIDKVIIKQGDTKDLKKGGGTGGSRSIPLGGVSASRAGEDLAEKIRIAAADEMEAAPGDIELVDGIAKIVGTDRQMSFADIASAAPETIKGFGNFKQTEATYPNGTHICEIEIDPDTGVTEIVNYQIVDDFGVTVNPMLLLGQVHGGVVQSIGQCLGEDTIYDEEGQLLTASFMDYTMPRADMVPNFKFETRNVPSTTNAMGIKGAGEAGTIGATPAVMNGIIDALYRAYGIEHIDMPATPHAVWKAITAAQK